MTLSAPKSAALPMRQVRAANAAPHPLKPAQVLAAGCGKDAASPPLTKVIRARPPEVGAPD